MIALSKRYRFVTPYTAFLAAPRSLLRPRRIQPGDPVLRVECDPATVSAIALLPVRRAARRSCDGPAPTLWEGRFLVPAGFADGRYEVRIVLRDASGALVSETKHFVIDGRAPVIVPELPAARAPGEPLRVAVRTDEDVIVLEARLGDGAPVPLRWDEASRPLGGLSAGAGVVAPGAQEVFIEAVDAAKNRGFAARGCRGAAVTRATPTTRLSLGATLGARGRRRASSYGRLGRPHARPTGSTPLATRFATVDGHRVHYPTPTAELAHALEGRAESAAACATWPRPGSNSAIAPARSRRSSAGPRRRGRRRPGRRRRAGEPPQGEMALAFRAAAQALPGLARRASGARSPDERSTGPTPIPRRPTGLALRADARRAASRATPPPPRTGSARSRRRGALAEARRRRREGGRR